MNSLKSRRLTGEDNPFDLSHWEFLYARSIGCIGLLKMHLNRALNMALAEDARTITLTHLRKTATPEVRVKAALRDALESEADLLESDGADERLLTLLGLRGKPQKQPCDQTDGEARTKRGQPGKRDPGRDTIGEASSEEAAKAQVAG